MDCGSAGFAAKVSGYESRRYVTSPGDRKGSPNEYLTDAETIPFETLPGEEMALIV